MRFHTAAALIALSVLAGCGPGPQASGLYQTRASQGRLFNAAREATTEIGYRVTNLDRTDGVITAEQGVLMGHGSTVGMSAVISASPGGTQTLQVNFVAPPGTFAMGNFNEVVDDYIAAVRVRVPDLHAAR